MGTRTSLADAIFTSTQKGVLGLLFGQPDRSFYATEIMAKVDGGRGAVQRELARLEASGLVSVHRLGSQKHFQANPSSPLFNELCSIVQKTVGLAEPIRKALEPLARSIEGAFLYGSIARAEDTARSDIDLMVLSDDLSYADLYSRLEAPATALGRPVNPTVFTPAEWRKKLRDRNAFAKKVQAQPKIWLIGGENGEPS